MKKTVWLLGASGLTGSHLGELLDEESDIFEVYAPVRTLKKKFRNVLELKVDFSKTDGIDALPKPEIVFCCIGTTIKKAGSEEAFLSIDYELVIQLAQIALKKGCLQFHLISSVGAKWDLMLLLSTDLQHYWAIETKLELVKKLELDSQNCFLLYF